MTHAIDTALRWNRNRRRRLPIRSMAKYRTLLVESLEYFHIHNIPLPIDGVTTVQDLSIECQMDPYCFMEALKRAHTDGDAIPLDDFLGVTLYDAIIATSSPDIQRWYRDNHIEIATEEALMSIPLRPTTNQILVLLRDGSVTRYIRAEDREQMESGHVHTAHRKKTTSTIVPIKGRITHFFGPSPPSRNTASILPNPIDDQASSSSSMSPGGSRSDSSNRATRGITQSRGSSSSNSSSSSSSGGSCSTSSIAKANGVRPRGTKRQASGMYSGPHPRYQYEAKRPRNTKSTEEEHPATLILATKE